MAFTENSLDAVRTILRDGKHPYASIEDGWLAAKNDHVVYAFRPNILSGAGWVTAETIDHWLDLTKSRRLIKLVEMWKWDCVYWISGTFAPVHIKGISIIPSLPTVQQMLRPFKPKILIGGIDTLDVFRRKICSVVTVDGSGARPAAQGDELLYDSKYIENATKALEGQAVRLWRTKQNALVIQTLAGDAIFLINPIQPGQRKE